MHGFSENMFDRNRWWPIIGFKDVRFAEQLTSITTKQCGAAFRGICDDDLIAAAVQMAIRPLTFSYALTLNSHLPVANISIPPDLAQACEVAKTGRAVCMLLAHQGIALKAVAGQLATRSTPLLVIVAGDHPPPFSDTYSRNQFLLGSVPLFLLAPKIIDAPCKNCSTNQAQTAGASTPIIEEKVLP